MIALAAASTIAVGLGVLSMPFGYYTFLRIVLCVTGAVGFAAARRVRDSLWPWIYGIAVVVYNPILLVHLGAKQFWIALNIATLLVFWAGALRFRGRLATPAPKP
jgi:hypothetical protein